MDFDQKNDIDNEKKQIFKAIAKEVINGISSNVRQKYDIIDLQKTPDHVNYSKVEKYLRSVNIEITHKMFFSYLKEDLLPGGHEVKNANFSYYTKEQIIYYMLVDMFKPILPLNKVKLLFSDILKPMIDDLGLEATYHALREMVNYMVDRFEEAVTMAIAEEELRMKKAVIIPADDEEQIMSKQHIAHYTDLVTLCMAKGALDFYKYSPNTLLD
jgi:hypothetical protein